MDADDDIVSDATSIIQARNGYSVFHHFLRLIFSSLPNGLTQMLDHALAICLKSQASRIQWPGLTIAYTIKSGFLETFPFSTTTGFIFGLQDITLSLNALKRYCDKDKSSVCRHSVSQPEWMLHKVITKSLVDVSHYRPGMVIIDSDNERVVIMDVAIKQNTIISSAMNEISNTTFPSPKI
ncbi:hypothetical protein RF11_01272 [Thelohanellus kitauei]|uniref:Uncharacterized protein n=1 Tax=Thelohanellus kitauei TaxID=669202 RepID=A0A0C2JN92_THEKT|nr:hypothetical protein RF11_01272 [Thelohanellus kitauei]